MMVVGVMVVMMGGGGDQGGDGGRGGCVKGGDRGQRDKSGLPPWALRRNQ